MCNNQEVKYHMVEKLVFGEEKFGKWIDPAINGLCSYHPAKYNKKE